MEKGVSLDSLTILMVVVFQKLWLEDSQSWVCHLMTLTVHLTVSKVQRVLSTKISYPPVIVFILYLKIMQKHTCMWVPEVCSWWLCFEPIRELVAGVYRALCYHRNPVAVGCRLLVYAVPVYSRTLTLQLVINRHQDGVSFTHLDMITLGASILRILAMNPKHTPLMHFVQYFY